MEEVSILPMMRDLLVCIKISTSSLAVSFLHTRTHKPTWTEQIIINNKCTLPYKMQWLDFLCDHNPQGPKLTLKFRNKEDWEQ